MLKFSQEQRQTQDQELKQIQRLELRPEILQLFRLLQISTLELWQEISQELQQNPLLELEEGSLEENGILTEEGEKGEEILPVHVVENNLQEDYADFKYEEEKDIDKALSEINWDEVFPDDRFKESSFSQFEEVPEERNGYLSNLISPTTETLEANLLRQISFLDLSDAERKIAEAIIGNINEKGYLMASIEEISKKIGFPVDKVESVLQIVQTLDPPGVAARNLQERIILELKHKRIQDPLVYIVVKDYFEDLQYHRYRKIAKKLEVPLKRIFEIVKLISSLDPDPVRQFVSETPHYIIPDVVVTKIDGEFIVRLNEELLPQLKISPVYQKMLRNKENLSQAEKKFLLNKFQAAKSFIRNIETRQEIIIKVAESIVKAQKEFFESGVEYLKPMSLREVAKTLKVGKQKTGVHESTIARVVSNKYIQTPHGIFPLKFFFSSSISKQSGENVTSRSVKELITDIIRNEDKRKPYSDEKITKLLRERGIIIARRTVSKYREELKILPAYLRKQF